MFVNILRLLGFSWSGGRLAGAETTIENVLLLFLGRLEDLQYLLDNFSTVSHAILPGRSIEGSRQHSS